MTARIVGEFCPAQDVLSEAVPEGIHRLVELHLPLVLLGCHPGEKVVLLIGPVGKLRDLNAQLPQGRFPVPHLIEDPGALPVELPGDVGGAVKFALMGKMPEFVGPQVDGHTGAVLSLPAHAHGGSLHETQEHLMGLLGGDHIPGGGDGVAEALGLGGLRGHQLRVAAVGVVPDGLPVLAQLAPQKLRVRLRQIADGIDAQEPELALRGRTHEK